MNGILNRLPTKREARSRAYGVMRDFLREIGRRAENPRDALENMILACDDFMFWAETVKETLMDLRPEAEPQRAAADGIFPIFVIRQPPEAEVG